MGTITLHSGRTLEGEPGTIAFRCLAEFLCWRWANCAPVAFLGCGRRFSGALSGIEPQFSVTHQCHSRPLHYRQANGAEVQPNAATKGWRLPLPGRITRSAPAVTRGRWVWCSWPRPLPRVAFAPGPHPRGGRGPVGHQDRRRALAAGAAARRPAARALNWRAGGPLSTY